MWPRILAFLAENKVGLKFAKTQAKKAGKTVFEGIEKVGTYVEDKTFKFIQNAKGPIDPTGPAPTVNKVKSGAAKLADLYLFPTNKKKAFASGFIGGSTRQAALHGLDAGVDLLLGLPKQILKIPQTSAFVRSFAGELIKQGGGRINVNSAKNMHKAFRTARKSALAGSKIRTAVGASDAANLTPSQMEEFYKYAVGLRRAEQAGHVSGRVTVAGTVYYVFTDGDTREERAQKFRESVKPYLYSRIEHKAKGQTRVDAYTRRDGTRVQAYWR